MNKIEQKIIRGVDTFKFIQKLHSPCWLIGIMFVLLKLTNSLDWSWWWISSPFWGYYIVLPIVIIIFKVLKFIFFLIGLLLFTGILKAVFKFLFSKDLKKQTKKLKIMMLI